MARQHRLVDRGDLVRQRVHVGGVDREHGVEQVREADPVGFGDEAEERTVAVEAPGTALLDDLEARFVVPIEELVGDLARGRLVGQLDRVGAEPLGLDDGDERIRDQAADCGPGRDLLQRCDSLLLRPGPKERPRAPFILRTEGAAAARLAGMMPRSCDSSGVTTE